MIYEVVHNSSEARALSLRIGVSVRPDEYPAVVVLSHDPDNLSGRPGVLILTWAQLVLALLLKKQNNKTAKMLSYHLRKELK